jgi:hypothetical protein
MSVNGSRVQSRAGSTTSVRDIRITAAVDRTGSTATRPPSRGGVGDEQPQVRVRVAGGLQARAHARGDVQSPADSVVLVSTSSL